MHRLLFALLVAVAAPSLAQAAIKTEIVTYKVGDQSFKGYLAYDDATKDKRPGVLVVHEWWGLNDYARKRVEQLAGLGYVAFAADLYGDGKTVDHPKDAAAMAGVVRKNQKEWRARALAGLKVLQDQPLVDTQRVAAIGYCLGGSTALQLAYAGADIAVAVSFHGGLAAPPADEAKAIKAKILICHGAADSFIKETTIQEVRDAYEKAKVDYQMIYFGNALHSFTVPDADGGKQPGLKYDAAADRRSWAAMRALFDEAFAKKK